MGWGFVMDTGHRCCKPKHAGECARGQETSNKIESSEREPNQNQTLAWKQDHTAPRAQTINIYTLASVRRRRSDVAAEREQKGALLGK